MVVRCSAMSCGMIIRDTDIKYDIIDKILFKRGKYLTGFFSSFCKFTMIFFLWRDYEWISLVLNCEERLFLNRRIEKTCPIQKKMRKHKILKTICLQQWLLHFAVADLLNGRKNFCILLYPLLHTNSAVNHNN